MGRESPMNPSPAGKPSITARDSVKSMGSFSLPGREGSKQFPGAAPYSSAGKGQGAKATQKGKFSVSPTPGGEYRQESYK